MAARADSPMLEKLKDKLKSTAMADIQEWRAPDFEANQMACPEIVIENVDHDLYGKMLVDATADGAKFDGNKAVISGVELLWTYDWVAHMLHATCTKKPFYFTCAEVESKIRQLVTKEQEGI